jgi:hypothetical protein
MHTRRFGVIYTARPCWHTISTHRREAMRERPTGTARSQRLPRPTTSQVLLLVLLAVGVIAGVQQRKAAVRPLVVS